MSRLEHCIQLFDSIRNLGLGFLIATSTIGNVRDGHKLGAQDSAHDHADGGSTHWRDNGVAGELGLYL